MLFQAVLNMRESVTYQAILKEGRRNILLRQGRDRFGEPSAEITALLFAETDLGRLEALAIRLLHVKTWEKLLGVNGTARHPRGRRKASTVPQEANLDEGAMWPAAFALQELTAAEVARIGALVKNAVS